MHLVHKIKWNKHYSFEELKENISREKLRKIETIRKKPIKFFDKNKHQKYFKFIKNNIILTIKEFANTQKIEYKNITDDNLFDMSIIDILYETDLDSTNDSYISSCDRLDESEQKRNTLYDSINKTRKLDYWKHIFPDEYNKYIIYDLVESLKLLIINKRIDVIEYLIKNNINLKFLFNCLHCFSYTKHVGHLIDDYIGLYMFINIYVSNGILEYKNDEYIYYWGLNRFVSHNTKIYRKFLDEILNKECKKETLIELSKYLFEVIYTYYNVYKIIFDEEYDLDEAIEYHIKYIMDINNIKN